MSFRLRWFWNFINFQLLATALANWGDVCDSATKSCGLHSKNIGFNNIQQFLVDSPVFTHGWTLYVNPFAGSCVYTNCTGNHTLTPCTGGFIVPYRGCIADPTTVRYVYDWSSMDIDLSFITIQSYYPGIQVLIQPSLKTIAANNQTGAGWCNVFDFHGSSVQLSDLMFNLVSSCRLDWTVASDLVPIAFSSANASGSQLSNIAASGALAVVRFNTLILTSGIMMNDVSLVDVINLAAPSGLPQYSALLLEFTGLVTVSNTASANEVVFEATTFLVDGAWSVYGDVTGTFHGINITAVVGSDTATLGCPLPPEPDAVTCHDDLRDRTNTANIVTLFFLSIIITGVCIAIGYGIEWIQTTTHKSVREVMRTNN